MSGSGLDRLAAAMEFWLQHRREQNSSPESVLAEHPDLRDLLEPLLHPVADGLDVTAGSAPNRFPALEGFRLLREIGRGGMGVVYEAVQTSLDRRVAVKLLAQGAELQPRAVVRFRREAATAARLTHPGIVDIHAVGEHDGRHWFAMELIDGERLDHHAQELRRRNPTGYVGAVVDLVAQVADALHHAHQADVVHRDVKPSNILVRRDGTPVVTDFGLCRISALPAVSQSGDCTGTPHYMAPEQVRGEADIDARVDVFALGITLYELLTQQLPFAGDTTRAVLDRILTAEPRPLHRLDSTLSRDLSAVVLCALAKSRTERYATMAAFAADLRRFRAGVPVLARSTPLVRRAWRWFRREPKVAAALGIGVVTLGLAVYLLVVAPAIRRGHAEFNAMRAEQLVLEAAIASQASPPRSARAALEEAVHLTPEDPTMLVAVALGEGTMRAKPDRLVVTPGHLARFAGNPAVRRLQVYLRQRAGDPAAAAELAALPPPTDPLDHYVAGEIAIRRAVLGVDTAAAAEAVDHLRRAVALTERPRATFLLSLNRAGRTAKDTATVLTAADALVRHWPESAASHCHRAMAFVDHDTAIASAAAQRSLELSPDNFAGLEVLAKIAERQGHPDASEHWERLQQLHPQHIRFIKGGSRHDKLPASAHDSEDR